MFERVASEMGEPDGVSACVEFIRELLSRGEQELSAVRRSIIRFYEENKDLLRSSKPNRS